MGLDRTVRFPPENTFTWEAVRDKLASVGEPVQLRLIDGLPAFPDETPPDDWRELRIGTSTGMVTIRRASSSVTCLVWGNADPALQQFWGRVIWACATAATGVVETPTGPETPEQFARSAGLFAA